MEREDIDDLIECLNRISGAIVPNDAAPGHDAVGGHVGSLVEAVMGVTKALTEVADAIRELDLPRLP